MYDISRLHVGEVGASSAKKNTFLSLIQYNSVYTRKNVDCAVVLYVS